MTSPTERFTPLDIETGSADDLYLREPHPSYLRLLGVGNQVVPNDPGNPIVSIGCNPYVTVNGHLFDFPALDRHCGIPVEQTIPFSRDLRVAAFQHDPPTTYQTSPAPGSRATGWLPSATGTSVRTQSRSSASTRAGVRRVGQDPVDDPGTPSTCVPTWNTPGA